MAKPLTLPKFQAFDANGNPLVAGKLYTYDAGTLNAKATYADYLKVAPNTNPVIMDGGGFASVYLDSGAYKLRLTDAYDVDIYIVDNVQADDAGSFTTLAASGAAALAAVSVTGAITSTLATGAAPLVVASTTNIPNLNASSLSGATFAAPGPVGSGTPSTGAFTTLAASGTLNATGAATLGSTLAVTGAVTESAARTMQTANAAKCIQGQISEEITLSVLGTTTDSIADLLPANSVIKGVTARITQAITTATDWKLGDGTQAARFCSAVATLVLGTTKVAFDHLNPAVASADLGPTQAAAAKLRITTTGTPGAGKIRVTVNYEQYVPATS